MYAFKNGSGDVLAVSSSDVSLEQVQAEIPEVLARIEGAPFGLVYKGSSTEAGDPGYYHRHVSGDGTQMADYEQVPDIDMFKRHLCSLADHECNLRIEAGDGFEWPSSSGNYFSLSLEAQVKWIGMDSARDLQSYPMDVPTLLEAVYSIASAEELHNMYLTGIGTVKYHIDACTVAKNAIMTAADKASAQAAFDAYMAG